MNDPDENQTVIDFLLESEKNLDAGARMARAFPAAQRLVAVSLLDALEKKVRDEFGASWRIRNPKDELFELPCSSFTVACDAWGEFHLKLEIQTYLGRTVVGIGRERKPQTSTLDDELANALAAAGHRGGTHRYWAWYKELPAGWGDWNNAPALAAIHARTEEAVQFFLSELTVLHRLAGPAIERFFARPSPAANPP